MRKARLEIRVLLVVELLPVLAYIRRRSFDSQLTRKGAVERGWISAVDEIRAIFASRFTARH